MPVRASGYGGVGGFLLWAELSADQFQALDSAPDERATLALLEEFVGAQRIDDPLRKQVLLELHLNSLYFARRQGFTSEKTATLFSIVKRNHDEMVESFLPPAKSWEFFKTLLLTHSVERPPYSIGIFTRHEAKQISQYVLDTYYRHFKLYRYAFTMRHVKEIELRRSWIELPCESFPPLADGVPSGQSELDEEPAEAPAAEPVVEMPPIELGPDVPEALKAAVEEQITRQVAAMREAMHSSYADRIARYEQKVVELEGKVKK
ncbi:hypothetical protein AB1Y20_016528 [Prymnesium parvum]|uniref:Coiled-coil domain-containing protein 189 n=1 Tax=Prymnesium parvum TaxID=97485 RepID=A0AB34IBK9_PRYPA